MLEFEMDFKVVTLPSGVSTTMLGQDAYDWPSIRTLAEAGVSYKEITKRFKGLNPNRISKQAKKENWLTPSRERKMRKELAEKQARALAQSGTHRDPVEVIDEIWEERGRRVNEMTYALVEEALEDAITNETGKGLIQSSSDLKSVVDVGRKVTGQDKREQEEQQPQMAINVAFLRSAGPSIIEEC